MKKFFSKICVFGLVLILSGCGVENGGKSSSKLQLSKDGKTDYVIVKPSEPSAVDEYAVNELQEFLNKKTKVKFHITTPDKLPESRKYIFIGLSEPALKYIEKNPINMLKDQEHIYKNIDDNIFLYGKGMHGNLYAVISFMENILGWRWYTKFNEPVVTVEENLTISSFNRKEGFDFVYRQLPHDPEFGYQHGMNMGFSERQKRLIKMYGDNNKYMYPDGVVSLKKIPVFVHTSFGYIPPSPEKDTKKFEWVENKNYFKTNPDFFTLSEKGTRVDSRQLCFGNLALQKELTKNILEHIAREGDDIIITLDANDNPGKFCHCPECQKLEEKYQSPGGPMYEYLFELCASLKEKYPKAMVKTLAYRTAQTQHPPKIPEGVKFPDNLIVVFANVEDKLNADWNNPLNRDTYKDLLEWNKLSSNIWTWYYPNNYGKQATHLPFGNIKRITTDIRLMKKAGCTGLFYEFTTPQIWQGNSTTELQIYLYCKLGKNVNADIPALIKEFTDYQYGEAASQVRKYIDELDYLSTNNKVPMPLTPRVLHFEGPHAYFGFLTLERLHKWQHMFDNMEKITTENERNLKNIQRLRRALEFATLARWNELTKKYPDYFKDYLVHKERLGKLNNREAPIVSDFEIKIKTNGKVKPLPEKLRNIPTSKVYRFVPEKRGELVMDDDGAFGYGKAIDRPDMPFNFGFYQNDKKVFFCKRELKENDIKPGIYQVYDLGEIEVTPKCQIWFSNKSWCTNLELGDRLYNPGEDNKYDVYVSLKFDGTTYGGKAEKDLVLCDQVIFIRKD